MIATGQDVREAREAMGYSLYELADLLRMGSDSKKGADYLRQIEGGKRQLSGVLCVALEALLSGWRP